MKWPRLILGAVVCVAGASAAGGQGVPPDRPATRPAEKLKWRDVCVMQVIDGRLMVRTEMTVDQVRALPEDPQELDGLPGMTRVRVSARRFEVTNVRRDGDDDEITLTLVSTRAGVNLDYQRRVDGRTWSVAFSQDGMDLARRSGRGEVRLSASGPAVALDGVSVSAADVAALRKERPHEVNRYLRPMLRRLGFDLLQVDPAAARQVLFPTAVPLGPTTRPAAVSAVDGVVPLGPMIRPTAVPATGPAVPPSPATRPAMSPADAALEAEVRRLLAGLNAPRFPDRQAALDRLTWLGPPALAVLAGLDRGALSVHQQQTIDRLLAAASPLTPDEAGRLRDDPHFLFDCLYVADDRVRAAAAERLTAVVKASAGRFDKVLAADPTREADLCVNLIEGLRDELVPAGER